MCNYFCSSPIISVFLNLYSSYPGPKQLKNTVSVILGYACLVAQLCPTLCDPMDSSPPGSSVPGILQARILEWVAMPSSRESSQPWDQIQISCIAGRFFASWATREVYWLLLLLLLLSLELCWTLWDSIDGSPPGSSVPGILQARILEWVAISFSNWLLHVRPNLHQGA